MYAQLHTRIYVCAIMSVIDTTVHELVNTVIALVCERTNIGAGATDDCDATQVPRPMHTLHGKWCKDANRVAVALGGIPPHWLFGWINETSSPLSDPSLRREYYIYINMSAGVSVLIDCSNHEAWIGEQAWVAPNSDQPKAGAVPYCGLDERWAAAMVDTRGAMLQKWLMVSQLWKTCIS